MKGGIEVDRESLLEKISHLPLSPGVYLWRDELGHIIYVGKAVQLRNRVRSYVRKDAQRSIKVASMMKRAVDVEVIQTKTEMEALILENTLIKEYKPKYNIMLKDDKTYPYVKITVQEDYPRVLMTRRMERDGAKYFGPFTDVGAVHSALASIQAFYKLRSCKSMKVKRPCLQFHLGNCLGPCTGYMDKAAYKAAVEDCVHLFEGKKVALLDDLQARMMKGAEDLQFELAADLRNQIQAIESIQEKQHVEAKQGDIDVIGYASDGKRLCVQLFFIRAGRIVGRENFFLDRDGEEDKELLSAFIKQYYDRASWIPKDVLLPVSGLEEELFASWFSHKKGQQVTVYVPQRGHKKELVRMATENAMHFLQERQRQGDKREVAPIVHRLAEVLHLSQEPYRMECFDISHMQGSETVASMVVFENGEPAKREYRKFKLKTVEGKPDDFASMAEVMGRRYGKEKDWPSPDLIVLDGGKGQLSAALPLIREHGVTCPVISLAKREEEVFIEGQSESILLDQSSPELKVLQHIRDESHRFAIMYHRTLRQKRNVSSILDHVVGLGPKRKAALWKSFGTLTAMKEASVEELAAVPTMTVKAAEELYRFFRLRRDEKQQYLQGIENS